MKEFVLEGKFWYAGDRLFIEVKDELAKEVYDEVCLNDLMKKHIKEESKVTITINIEDVDNIKSDLKRGI